MSLDVMTTHNEKHPPRLSALATTSGTPPEGDTMLFYQAGHLATELSDKGIRHIVRSHTTVIAQLDPGKAAHILHVDQANSVLNKVPDKTTYAAYGFFEAGQSTAILAFNGQRLDPLTRTYALGNGNRTYHPTLFRFSSPDLLSPFDQGGLNAYAYCNNDPINKMDPSGNVPQFIRSFFKGAANRLRLRTPKGKTPPPVLKKFTSQEQSPVTTRTGPLPERSSGQRLSEGSRQATSGRNLQTESIEKTLLSHRREAQKELSLLKEQLEYAHSQLKRRKDLNLGRTAEANSFSQLTGQVKKAMQRVDMLNQALEGIRKGP